MPDVAPLPDRHRHLVPEACVAASDVLAERLAQLDAATARVREAEATAEQAPAEDRKAAAAAVEQGKSLPKPKTGPAEQALAVARRELDATLDLAAASADAYIREVRIGHAEIAEAIAAEIEYEGEQAKADFEKVEGALNRARSLRFFRDALGDDARHLEGRFVSFKPRRSPRQEARHPIEPALRDALALLREEVGS
jgi:hypothetical protein